MKIKTVHEIAGVTLPLGIVATYDADVTVVGELFTVYTGPVSDGRCLGVVHVYHGIVHALGEHEVHWTSFTDVTSAINHLHRIGCPIVTEESGKPTIVSTVDAYVEEDR